MTKREKEGNRVEKEGKEGKREKRENIGKILHISYKINKKALKINQF